MSRIAQEHPASTRAVLLLSAAVVLFAAGCDSFAFTLPWQSASVHETAGAGPDHSVYTYRAAGSAVDDSRTAQPARADGGSLASHGFEPVRTHVRPPLPTPPELPEFAGGASAPRAPLGTASRRARPVSYARTEAARPTRPAAEAAVPKAAAVRVMAYSRNPNGQMRPRRLGSGALVETPRGVCLLTCAHVVDSGYPMVVLDEGLTPVAEVKRMAQLPLDDIALCSLRKLAPGAPTIQVAPGALYPGEIRILRYAAYGPLEALSGRVSRDTLIYKHVERQLTDIPDPTGGGPSGAPVLQHGRIVGVIFGDVEGMTSFTALTHERWSKLLNDL